MIQKIVKTPAEALADVRDGATVMIGGFGTAGQPNELIDALIDTGAKDLVIVNNNAGNGDTGLAALLAKKRVRKIICSFPRQSDSHHFDALYRAGELELELVPQGNLAERIRAAGAGIGGFFTPTGYGTELAKGKETREINGKMYVLEGEKTKVASGSVEPSPLTLHVNVGDCIKVNLKNEMVKDRAGFHVDNLAYDPKESMGINAGNNPGDQTVAPGQSRTYTFYAHPEFGENTALIQDWGNVIENPRNGLFGAIIIGPKGSQYRDPVSGEDLAQKSSWKADVFVDRSVSGNERRQNYR